MDLLHRVGQSLVAKFREQNTVRRLQRLDDRNLADLGLARDEIRPVARLAAQMGPQGVAIRQVVEQVRRNDELGRAKCSAHVPSDLDRSIRHPSSDLERFVREAHRMRAEMISEFGRALRRRFAATELGRSITLSRLRRREQVRVTRELESYSPQELMADLRVTRSEIAEIAAEGADRAVDTFVQAHPDYRRAAGCGDRGSMVAHARS